MKKMPKDRRFLGLTDDGYWVILQYVTRKDGAEKAAFVDSGWFEYKNIIRWEELPEGGQ